MLFRLSLRRSVFILLASTVLLVQVLPHCQDIATADETPAPKGPPSAGLPVAGHSDNTSAQFKADLKMLQDAKLPSTDAGLLDFFRKRLVSPKDRTRIEEIIKKLASPSFKERQQAAADLTKEGPPALPVMRAVMSNNNVELQTKQLCQRCIKEIEKSSPSTLVLAAARLLKVRQTPGALAALLEYAALAPDDDVEWEVFGTIYYLALTGARLEVFPPQVAAGTLNPNLVDALKDQEPARRAIAALIVGQFGTDAQRQMVRALLDDAEPKVRFHAARGLLLAHDQVGIPVLVELLHSAPWHVALQSEDVLVLVAGQKNPDIALTAKAEARKNCHKAWRAWWENNKDRLDLTKMELEAPFGGEVQRASRGAIQFLRAFFKFDPALVARTTEIPFSIYGRLNFDTREEFDSYLNVRKQANMDLSGMRITVIRVLSAAEYMKGAQYADRLFLESVRPAHIQVVCVDLSDSQALQERKESHAVFVRTAGGGARCVGIGRPPQTR
jgi:hypothetical protein